jgi:NAD(P)-dependent dehydrogenase (short-subunit alcohol dehydrogenase family)
MRFASATPTSLIPSTIPADKVQHFGDNTPLERPAQPAELASACVLLSSGEASYITGAMLPVTGDRPMLEAMGPATPKPSLASRR